MIEVKIYKTKFGKEPFSKWLKGIKNRRDRIRIQEKLRRIELGNFGDFSSVGDGVFESRLHFGPGYRVYYAYINNLVILLLAGGDKSSQQKDIKQAKLHLKDYEQNRKI